MWPVTCSNFPHHFQVKELARELHAQHFGSANLDSCLVTSEVGRIVQDMMTACQGHNQDSVSDTEYNYCQFKNTLQLTTL